MSDTNTREPSERLKAIHEQMTKGIDASYRASQVVRARAVESRRFCDVPGAQWADWIGEQFENRYKPEINKIAKSVARIFNEYRNNRITVDFQPDTAGADDKVADLFDDMHRADERDSCAQEAYDCAFQEGLKGGYGGWRLCTDYEDHEDEENERQRIQIIPSTDADSCLYFDVDARRYDKADAKYGWLIRGMSREAYEAEWPQYEVTSLEKPLPDGSFTWFLPDVIYVAECYVRETYKSKVYTYRSELTGEERRLHEDEVEEQIEELRATGFVLNRSRSIEKRRVHKYIINGQRVIEDCGIIAGEHIPLIPYYGNRSVIDGVEQVWGLVGPGKDAQQLYNMQVGVIGEQAAMGQTAKPILMPEQIAGHEYMWAYDNIQRNPYLLLNAVRDAAGQPMPAGPIAFTQPPMLSQATSALIDISNRDILDVTGNMDQGQNLVSNVSAEAMQLSQDRIDMGSFGYMDAMAKSMRRHGEVWQSMRRDIETERRKVRTIKSDGSEGSAELFVPVIGEDGAETLKNDISKGKYKVFADVGPSFTSRRKATISSLLELMGKTPDPQQQAMLSNVILLNSQGEGLEDLRNYTRKSLVQQGVIPPTEEEKAEMEEAQANAQPDPQAQFLLAEAEKAQANAVKAQADTELTKAKTAETLAAIDTDRLKLIMDALDRFTQSAQAQAQMQQQQAIPEQQSIAPEQQQ